MIDFATLLLNTDSRGLVDGKEAMQKLGGQADQTEKRVSAASQRMSSAMRSLAVRAGALAAALAPAALFSGAISEGRKFETEMFRIDAIIKATGGTAGRTSEQLREQAREIALNTLESTEGILEAQRIMLTFRNIQGDVFDDAIIASADLAAAMGQSVSGAAMQLSRALEDPVRGVSALARSGTVFTEAQKEMIEAMVDAGRTADAQRFILSELEAQYGGAAAAAAKGLAGAQDTLGQRMQELLLQINESLGLTDKMTVVYNSMADAVLYVTEGIRSLTTFVQDNAERLRAYGIAAAAAFSVYMAPAVLLAAKALGTFIIGLRLTRAALLRTGIGVIVVLLGEAIYRIDRMVDRLGGFGNTLRLFGEVAKEVWERFGDGVSAALYTALELWQNFKFTAYNAMQGAVDAAYSGTNKMIGAFVGAKDAIIATWRAIPGAIGDLVFQAANSLIQGVESMLNAAIRRIDAFVGKIKDALAAVGIETAFGGIGDISLGGVENPFVGQAAAVGKAASEAFTAAMDVNYTGDAPRLFGRLAADAASMQAIYASMASSFRDLAGRPLTSVQAIVDRLRESGEAAGQTEEEIRTVAEALAAVNEEAERLGGTSGGKGKKDKDSEGLPSILNDLVPPLQKLAGAAGQMQSAFADAFTDMVMGAKSAKEALAGLLQMAAQALINRAFANAFAFVFGAADGAVMSSGNVVPFAKGGVVGGPTAFGMSGGRTGLMGEAGPEAIMPLKRGADGKLGVASSGKTERIELAVIAEEGEMFAPRVRQISGNVAIQVSTQASQLQRQAFGSTLTQYDQRGTTA